MFQGRARMRLALATGLALAAGGPLDARPVRAQEPPTPAKEAPPAAAEPTTGPRLADIEAEIAQLRARREEWTAAAAEMDQARRDAPARLARIETEIAQLQKREGFEVPANATAAELEVAVLDAEQDLALARQDALEIEAEAAHRADRRKKIPELLAAAKDKLRKLATPTPAPASAGPELVAALAQLDQARKETLEAEIQAYQSELASYEARGQLLIKRRDRATLRIASEEARATALRTRAKELQRSAADRAAEAARASLEQMGTLPPRVQATVRQVAEENARLAQLRTGDEGLVEKIAEVSAKLARAEEQVAAVETDFAKLSEKIEAAGLTDSVALLLRRQRSEAPDVGKYRRFIRMREALVSTVQLQQIELRDQRGELADIDRNVERAVAELDDSLSRDERAEVEVLLRNLYEAQRATMDALIDDYESYFQRLIDFDAKQQELIDRTEHLLRFIDERILWVPSGDILGPWAASDVRDALGWLLSPRFVAQLGKALRDFARLEAVTKGLLLLVLLAWLPLVRRAHRRIRELGEEARSPDCIRYRPTVEALFLTLLLVVWPPALLAYVGWSLESSPGATLYVRCIASGLMGMAGLWLTLRLPRQILRPDGLAESHLGWPVAAVRALRRHLAWLTAVALPAVFLIYVFEARGEEDWRESIGRIAFLVAMTAVVAFAAGVFRPRGPAAAILRTPGTLFSRAWVWRLVSTGAVAVPALLALGALIGFYWTAFVIASSQHETLVFLFILLVVYRLCVRWALLAGRPIALSQARLARDREAAKHGERESEAPEVAEPEVDLAAVGAQTARLLKGTIALVAALGLWAMWSDVLPAAGLASRVELWTVSRPVTVASTDARGIETFTREDRIVPVTLTDLALALAIGIIGLALVRNVPGLLDVTLFRRLGAGERYAYTAILQYSITIVAVILAFDAIGVGWSSIQWLVAAVGLGLGFGLQEIFANFVSGLIILFERPIRVGDTVTVGDVSGTVTKVRIRATWITSFDRKELVVPNKEFVTSRLINWSLSDAVLRVEIPVGIAYGSDTERALEVLRRVAEQNELVLREPPPQVLFLGFGDSSLSFELRVFSPDVSRLLPIRHQLHMAIDRAFREAGIEIAFPQRDLHVRSLPKGEPPAPPGGADTA